MKKYSKKLYKKKFKPIVKKRGVVRRPKHKHKAARPFRKVKANPRIKPKPRALHCRKSQKPLQPKKNKKTIQSKPAYILNTDFGSFFELRDLILKSLPAEKDTMTERINKLGRVKLAVISGVFMNKDSPDPYIPDLLIVGDDLDKRKLRSFLKAIEAEVGKEIKFVILDKEEFQYRLAMFDRFIRVLLEGPHEKLINRLGI